ncbi:M1 family metallopeptidase [Temperatibacter marinus]|uniref:M1 family metallopeptidase n=1 Tax=Temperatibacter marinus TaxID=1456591 RepID=A0AA52EIC5_9PROT|nr:M1 family metallopeptidase [Temperatibacter marinus]WND02849.1 M1 family metallopeptidase [Temperatibacter marinus]
MHNIVAKALLTVVVGVSLTLSAVADTGSGAKRFKQLTKDLPSPNVYRDASGAPGPMYWQQRADYKIKVTLDEKNRRIIGSETIKYTNNSPLNLRYIWIQLDQNRFNKDSIQNRTSTSSRDRLSYGALDAHYMKNDIDFGQKIRAVKSGGKDLPYVINDTQMRIDLPKALKKGQTISFSIDWDYNIIQEAVVGGRNGFEHFEKNDTYIYFMAQWFPRLSAFTDYTGWQNKQFLGRGEFALEFGDYDVEITVPADHVVSSTGVLTNAKNVLTKEQYQRFEESKKATKPMYIVTPEEALENEKEGTDKSVTWKISAKNVRDFAWSSSRKYVWDAMNHKQQQTDAEYPDVHVMSFYPQEAMPIWNMYSSHAVAHTMDVYSKMSFPYPYPTAQSVNTWAGGGMEYPMITFNGYRPTDEEKLEDRTYTRRAKYGLIGVIIHEIGHIYFPMVVNSDERRWTWMDEGLNTFLEYITEIEWEENYPAFGNEVNILDYIDTYMKSDYQVPIMTQSDSVIAFGPNAYSKPASALIVLRETVMGRELFDHAFREYSNRWKFKRPTPADFFRTMEDASGVDLDWFWRGWFFTTDHVDVAINDVREYRISTQNPEVEFDFKRKEWNAQRPEPVQQSRNRQDVGKLYIQDKPELLDFYNKNDQFLVTNKDRNKYNSFLEKLKGRDKATYERALKENPYIYFVDFANKGGIPSPLPVTFHYVDGTTSEMMIPAEIWRYDSDKVSKMFIFNKALAKVTLDDKHQTADVDYKNNSFPQAISKSRLELYKYKRSRKNLMKDALEKLKKEKAAAEETKQVPLTQTN